MRKNELASVFQAMDHDRKGKLTKDRILESLSNAGILSNDVRLSALLRRMEVAGGSLFGLKTFGSLLDSCESLISRAVRGELVIPEFQAFSESLKNIYDETRHDADGAVASYIPQLARVPADNFAVAVSTIDGQQCVIGDADYNFTLQSSCKPLLYAAALEELGVEKVHSHVGREPSGLSFNELSLNKDGLPHNPMINAGAIMTSSLIRRGCSSADRLEYLHNLVKTLSAGVTPNFNTAVWHSERETADRNFALAHHMREHGAFPEGTQIVPTLDYYFSACSMEVTARTMSTIGATFANGGVCPSTGDKVFSEDTVKNTLSMMYSCGMYDYSGEFAFTVGIPAKSAVSGVVLAIVPNVLSIAVWSPKLDSCGNSVRGVAFLKKLVERFSFHNYDGLVESKKSDPRRRSAVVATDQTYQAIYAASVGDTNELKRLVARGHDLNTADYDGRTPLHLAAAEGQIEVVRFLMRHKVHTEPKDRWGFRPIDDAKRHKRNAVIEELSRMAA
ncbi:MAG: glutaminase A [Pseudomonadota bacterium]